MRCKAGILAGIATAFLSTGDLRADDFTAADVLEWERDSQDWYFQVSVTMAGVIAAQNESPQAECINDWYFSPAVDRNARNNEIRETMSKFSNYHPASVVIAAIERECGTLSFPN